MIDIRLGNCLDILPSIPDASVDCVITDPPYPCIKRDYGMLSESEWWDLMMGVCKETRRILKPSGSAVFILQPNSHKIGSMRGWLFKFQNWVCREWNMVQDAWWWNPVVPPNGLTITGKLMRSSVKACVWAGSPSCFRDQDAVLWEEAQETKSRNARRRVGLKYSPSGNSVDGEHAGDAALRRGGVTPFNLLPFSNSDPSNSHGASTPLELAKWWTRYICPPGGVVLDPFFGSGTMGVAALEYGNSIIGIEQMEKHYLTAFKRIHGDASA